MGPKKKSAGTEPPAKRRRMTNNKSAHDTTNDASTSDVIQSLTQTITSNIMAELKKVGVLPNQNSQVELSQHNQQEVYSHQGLTTHEEISAAAAVASDNHLPDINGNVFHSEYKPLGRPLHTYVTPKLKEKILSNEFVQMSDILDPPTEMDFVDFHLSIKDKGKVGLTSNKKKKYVTIEEWTDAFSIFSSVLRQGNPDNHSLSESLAVYMHLIRSIQKDGGIGSIMI